MTSYVPILLIGTFGNGENLTRKPVGGADVLDCRSGARNVPEPTEPILSVSNPAMLGLRSSKRISESRRSTM